MRVLFLHYGEFHVNSVIQAFHLGEEMTAAGIEVALCGKGPPERIETVGEPSFECVDYEGLERLLRRWGGEPKETVICAWTPREVVRKATERAAEILEAPYVVHLEDNEEHLLSGALRLPYEELARLPRARLDRICTDDFVHPSHYPRLLERASAVTGITEELNEFNFGARPYRIARPGVDHERFRPDLEPAVSRRELGLGPDDFVIVYHGVGHFANQHELLSLYVAVKLLQRRGRPVKLVRLGTTRLAGVDPRSFRALMDDMVELGHVQSWGEVPGYLALADAFVQPGAPDEFNRYRLPSKLPEFLSMGRPVILPACNLGDELVDGEDALLLREGTALEIASRIEDLLDAPELARRLGERARKFALERLSWRRNAAELADFYRSALEASREAAPGMTAGRQTEELVPDERLWELKRLYGEFEVPPISYGTVRDFADSLDNLGGLARANSDMKDLQRCWAVKAVLGNVQRRRAAGGDRSRRAARGGHTRAPGIRGDGDRPIRRQRAWAATVRGVPCLLPAPRLRARSLPA